MLKTNDIVRLKDLHSLVAEKEVDKNKYHTDDDSVTFKVDRIFDLSKDVSKIYDEFWVSEISATEVKIPNRWLFYRRAGNNEIYQVYQDRSSEISDLPLDRSEATYFLESYDSGNPKGYPFVNFIQNPAWKDLDGNPIEFSKFYEFTADLSNTIVTVGLYNNSQRNDFASCAAIVEIGSSESLGCLYFMTGAEVHKEEIEIVKT